MAAPPKHPAQSRWWSCRECNQDRHELCLTISASGTAHVQCFNANVPHAMHGKIPEATSQSRTILSLDPDTAFDPSAERLTEYTFAVWPFQISSGRTV